MPRPRLTLDFETYFDKDYSLTKMTIPEYVRDPRFQAICCTFKLNGGETHLAWGDDIARAVSYYKTKHPDAVVVGHNLQFDGLILSERYGWTPDLYIDTIGLSRARLRLASNALAAVAAELGLAEKIGDYALPKGVRLEDLTEEQKELLASRCIRDSDLTDEIVCTLIEGMPAAEIAILDWTIRAACNPLLEVDVEMLEAYAEKVVTERNEEVSAAGLSLEQLRSNQQFAELLTTLGVQPPMKKSDTTGLPTFAFAKDDEGLKDLLNHPKEEVRKVVSLRMKYKSSIEQTRALKLAAIGRTGKLPVPLNYFGAHTGRLSGGGGINLQNLTRGSQLRNGIVAPPGFVCVVGDSSQIEARVLAYCAGQLDLVEVFATGGDPYCEMATAIYGFKVNKKDHPDQRWMGKVVVLGAGYGMGRVSFRYFCAAQGVTISAEFADKVITTYRRKNNMIQSWWSLLDDALSSIHQGREQILSRYVSILTGKNVVYCPTGLPLIYPGLSYDKRTRGWRYNARGEGRVPIYGGLLTENIVQKLARDVVMQQLLVLQERYPVALQVHDELVLVVPEEEAEEAKRYMLQVMSTPPEWAPDLPVAAEVGYHRVYGKAKK